MKHLICILTIMTLQSPLKIFDFSSNSDIKNWRIINDTVMGGESFGLIKITPNGHAKFTGSVSTANNGGFSSLRYNFNKSNVNKFSKIVLKIKGDNKNYQFRIKHKVSDYYSYITSFPTNGEWQEIELPLKDFYPSFRGRKIAKNNFEEDSIEHIAFLIGNKKNEKFELLVDNITLK